MNRSIKQHRLFSKDAKDLKILQRYLPEILKSLFIPQVFIKIKQEV